MPKLPQKSILMTETEYLEFERNSEIRHEYIQGVVRPLHSTHEPLSDPSTYITHNRLKMSLSYVLYGQLRGKGCEIYGGDMRVMIKKADVITYPDFSVFCGSADLTDDNPPALLNPMLIIEVLSPTIEQYDRGKKFQHYRNLPSLQEYILVSQDAPRIERFFFTGNDIWEFMDTSGLDASLTLRSIDGSLALADVYENVVFEDIL